MLLEGCLEGVRWKTALKEAVREEAGCFGAGEGWGEGEDGS